MAVLDASDRAAVGSVEEETFAKEFPGVIEGELDELLVVGDESFLHLALCKWRPAVSLASRKVCATASRLK